jgi:hypothetical protein
MCLTCSSTEVACHIAFVRNQQKTCLTAERPPGVLRYWEVTRTRMKFGVTVNWGPITNKLGSRKFGVLTNLHDVDCGVVFTICALPLALRLLLYSDDNTCHGVADCKRKWGARCSAKS